MNKGEGTKLNSLFIDLNDRSSDNIISQSIAEIKNSGYTQVNLEVKTSTELEAVKLQVDIDLFTRIKEVQDLPDWVIVKLILADGKLKDSSFKERVSNG
jgi:tRNA-binding EMAP/Myf-like protein